MLMTLGRRKAENQDLSQMIMTILTSDLELAKAAPGVLPQFSQSSGNSQTPFGDHSRNTSLNGASSSHMHGQSLDLSSLNLNGDTGQATSGAEYDSGEPFMFIPPDPQAFYRQLLKEALAHELHSDDRAQTNGANGGSAVTRVLSKSSTDLLAEVGSRWRIPHSTRLVLIKDVVRELLSDQAIDLDTLDAALSFVKDPSPSDKKQLGLAHVSEPSMWPLSDISMDLRATRSMHNDLLRDLFERMLQSFEAKPPDIGPIMTLLESHIYEDPHFDGDPEDLDSFTEHFEEALYGKARGTYDGLAQRFLRPADRGVEFFDVMQLGQAVVKDAQRIQKRFRKMPPIMGVQPAPIFIKVVLPAFAADAHAQITTILRNAQARGEEVPMEDGFELYRSMVDMRQIHQEVLPKVEFAFNVEGLLAPFVWRWIASTDERVIGWVDAAVRQDNFRTRNEDPSRPPNDDERHSVSVIDIFRSFNESINQIVDLKWDDDYQYAKFMTSLSKSIGAGLTKYCEQLEKYFIAEMDRATPEQEVSASRTRQEKWVRLAQNMARDAMATREKVEPFQFLPEVWHISYDRKMRGTADLLRSLS